MIHFYSRISFLVICLLAVACPACLAQAQPASNGVLWTAPSLDPEKIMEHIRILASDQFEGRAPGTNGEIKTVAYLTQQLRQIGLKPGNPDGTYIQKVPLVGITVNNNPTLQIEKGAQRLALKWRDDFVAWTKQVKKKTTLAHSALIFAGYGIRAPEFQWDDFKGVDLRGKTIVVLIGDPPLTDPQDRSRLDPALFGGKAMTYYGRWTYKYEMGAKLGAAGVLIVHETEPAGYPFAVVQGKTAEQFDLFSPDKNKGRVAVEGWITKEKAEQLFALCGKDFETLKKQALDRNFAPIPLQATVSLALSNSIRTVSSNNVIGKVEGRNAAKSEEFVMYTAHWDHFGIGVPVNGDKIYNGALDNASGVAGTLELARAFAGLKPPLQRTVLFLFVTAEEQGLLGSGFYAGSPLYPLAQTAAVINIDGLNLSGKTRDAIVVGLGLSELDDTMQKAAAQQGRTVLGDPTPEKGSYYRSDHFPFAKQGVPAINPGGGIDYIGKPAGWGLKIRQEFTANHYHKPSDEIRPDWTLDGAQDDLSLYFMVGMQAAQAEKMPEWKEGAEFKSKRKTP